MIASSSVVPDILPGQFEVLMSMDQISFDITNGFAIFAANSFQSYCHGHIRTGHDVPYITSLAGKTGSSFFMIQQALDNTRCKLLQLEVRS